MTGLILAAGKGTRLFPGRDVHVSKPLVRIADKPLISYSLDNLGMIGVTKAVITVGDNCDDICRCLGDEYNGIQLTYAVQERPLGLVNAIVSARNAIDDDIILQLSDEILLNFFPEQADPTFLLNYDFAVGYTEDLPEKIKRNFSIETDACGRVLSCVEKPDAPPNLMKGIGFCFFSYECMRLLFDVYDGNANFPKELCDFINMLSDKGKFGRAVRFADEEININTPGDLEYAKKRLECL